MHPRRQRAARRSFLWAAHYCAALATYPEVVTHRAGTSPAEARAPPLFGLAPCGVFPATAIAGGAVRSYRTFSPLPRRAAGRYVFCGTFRQRRLNAAARTLSGTPLCGVRTFLCLPAQPDLPAEADSAVAERPVSTGRQRPSGPAANPMIIDYVVRPYPGCE